MQSWQVTAAMDGLGVVMPYPLGKLQHGARPLHADLEVGDDLLARASYGDVRALLRMQARRMIAGRSIAAACAAMAWLLHCPRIAACASKAISTISCSTTGSPCAAVPRRSAATAGGGKLADVLQAANVRVGQLNLYGYRWNDVRGVLQATDSGWRVDVAGPDIAGQVQIPATFTGELPLVGDHGSSGVAAEDSAATTRRRQASERDPRAWPSLRIHVADLQMDEHAVGEIDLKATRVANGLQIDSIHITQDRMRPAKPAATGC